LRSGDGSDHVCDDIEVSTALYKTRLSNGNGAKLKHCDPQLVNINKQEIKE
jgi:hypothetical protein